jgi:hypothetical protein
MSPPLQGRRKTSKQAGDKLATCLLAGFAEPISSTRKMEVICSSETSVETQ